MNDNTPRTNSVEDSSLREHAESLEVETWFLRQALSDAADPESMVKRKQAEGIKFSAGNMASLSDVNAIRGIADKGLRDHAAKFLK